VKLELCGPQLNAIDLGHHILGHPPGLKPHLEISEETSLVRHLGPGHPYPLGTTHTGKPQTWGPEPCSLVFLNPVTSSLCAYHKHHKPYSYGHLLVITGYKWDYTFYKWGFLSTYNWYFGP